MTQSTYITNIQKFSIHDGPGIRTNIFFKGCQLECKWCANPETIKACPQLLYYKRKCVSCGTCVSSCPNKALELSDEGLIITNAKCNKCGICVKECPTGALELVGQLKTPDEVFEAVNQDKVFYQQSGGGVTFSGGEPFLHTEFIEKVASRCNAEGYSVIAETCGHFDLEKVLKIIDLFDMLLFDIKMLDDGKHMEYCSKSNQIILKNFDVLINKVKIVPRIPIIPSVNDTPHDIDLLCDFLKKYREKIPTVHILPYHDLGYSKYEALKKPYELSHIKAPSTEHMQQIKKKIADCGFEVIIGG